MLSLDMICQPKKNKNPVQEAKLLFGKHRFRKKPK